MPISPNSRLGTYQILGPLGVGGMGEVYRARDTRLGREIAIKVLPAEVAASPDRLARFEREARTVAGLNHPNIVTLFSVEEEEGVPFLTMELVEGQTLDSVVAPGGLPVARLLDLAIPMAGALICAHERGVVHRDLKPGNVMVTRDGWVKVLDFGLAKAAAASGDLDRRTMTVDVAEGSPISGKGEIYGTVPYMAPEQIRGEALDARTDLFAFGTILYELATGRRPFTGGTSADLISAILRDAPVPVSSLRNDLPRDLHRVIARCLEKNPHDRLQTARDVLNELRHVQREMGGAPSTPGPSPAVPPLEPPSTSPPTSDVPSIAVLPFVNRSRAEDDEYFSDGLADELLSVLTKVRGLRVTARASSFQFKGKNEDPAVIGRMLNVETLLDGAVRKSGNRVRISVQLVKAADRVQLWSETYDRSLDDIFAVQDEIAQAVVKELRTTLLGETPDSKASGRARDEVAKAGRDRGHDPEAHRLYLQGKYFLDRLTPEDTTRGIGYLDEAVTADPSHVPAWLELSRAHGIRAGYSWGESAPESRRKAREAAERALELAPESAEAHVRLANVEIYLDWNWKGAEESVRRALELSPQNNAALRSAGTLAIVFGRFEEAESYFRRANHQDPLNPFGYHSLGNACRFNGRLDQAEEAYRKALELAPQRAVTRGSLAIVLADQGRDAEAVAEASRETEDWGRWNALAHAHARAGRKAEADEALGKLIANHATTTAYQIAGLYALRGEVDEAFAWLDRAIEERDTGVSWAWSDPILQPLRGDPRWTAAMRRLGFNRSS